ncbi:MAG: LysR family transcriptional regulator [Candidatus Lokiarchaeota archaeon]|nr:LysR family transcriptional regulator [Candidatus Lokiarchaeota archaeon]
MEASKLRILDLQAFITLVKEKNFSKAGARLGMTQSSVTQVIQKLEEDLGTKLISRSSKYFTLTGPGKVFLDAATDIVSRFVSARQEIGKLDKDERDKLKIAVSTTPGEFILPPFFSQFTADVPGVRLIIEMCDSKKAISMLFAKECQVAIVGSIMERIDADHEERPLFKERLVVIVSKNAELDGDGRIPIDALANMTRVDREAGSGTQNEAGGYLEAIKAAIEARFPGHEDRALQLQSVQAVMAAVASSPNTYAIVGEFPATRYSELGQVRVAKVQGVDVDASRMISAVYNKHEVTENLRVFLGSIEKFLEMRSIWEKSEGGG